MLTSLEAKVDARDEKVRQALALFKTSLTAWVMATHEASWVEVSKPHMSSGKRDAKELDNYLWHMERYFKALTRTNKQTKVHLDTLYLIDNATLWWRRRFIDIE